MAPPEARFCPACGHSLVARPDERRVVTILFADLVGFTSFSEGSDPEQVKALVDECFEALTADVRAYGGEVDKIVGDALLALFGAPTAHEDDAERAVRCALRMQRTLATVQEHQGLDVQLRVGVNTGEVLVGALRAGGDYTAMGDVVNTANRLQTFAAPGQVVVGAQTHQATEHVVQYEPLGLQNVRGRTEPVAAFLALGAPVPPGTRRGAHTPIVGRDAEIGLLRAVLDTALTRQRAHLVLLTGGAGVGKSRLASEATRHAAEDHAAKVFTGRCVPYGEDVWWPIAETIRTLCDVPPQASHETARTAVYEAVAKAMNQELDEPAVARIGRGLLYLLGYAAELNDVDPVRARDDALRSGVALFGYLAREYPVVLVLSDLHWADDLILDLVNRLLDTLRTAPFVLVATARPDLEDRWRPEPGRHNLSVINLEPLDAEAGGALVDELLGDDATPQLRALLYERSGGNPFFLEELAALIRDSGPGALGVLSTGRLPATLQGLVTARLDTLTPEERDVIADCAVVGTSGPIDAVQTLTTARGLDDASPTLARLTERELLELDNATFRFPSEVVRDVAYGMLTKGDRARRHAVLADWLAAGRDDDDGSDTTTERIAHHYGAAALLLREVGAIDGIPADLTGRALKMLEQAADRARTAELWPSASRLFEQALAVLPADTPDETRWRLLLGHATALTEQRELTAARADVDSVLADEPAPRTAARAQIVLAHLDQMAGNPARSIEHAEAALAASRAIGDEQGAADALRARGITFMFDGDLDAADRDLTDALQAFLDCHDRRGEAWALQNLASIAFFRSDSDKADDRLERSAAVFRELGDYGGLNWCEGIRAWVRFTQGRLDEAEALAVEQLPETEATGNRWVGAILTLLLTNLALWRGESQQAVVHAEETLTRFQAITDPWGVNQAQASVVRALACVGRVGDALDVLDAPTRDDGGSLGRLLRAHVLVHIGSPEALPAALHLGGTDENSNRELRAGAHLVLGLALLQAGRVDEAVAEVEAARRNPGTPGAGFSVAVSAGLALAYAAAGRSDEARALADANVEAGTYLDQLQHRLAGAFAALQLDAPDAAARFDGVVAASDATESRLDQAVTRLARAQAWRASGRDDADVAEDDARRRLAAMGIDASGWVRLFSAAVGT